MAEFTVARIDEDSRYARAALNEDSRGAAIRIVDGELAILPSAASDWLASHIVRNGPARAIRRADGMRAILADYQETCRLRDEAAARIRAAGGDASARDLDTWDRARQEASVLWPVIAQLAAAWNDHPSYRDEWKP